MMILLKNKEINKPLSFKNSWRSLQNSIDALEEEECSIEWRNLVNRMTKGNMNFF